MLGKRRDESSTEPKKVRCAIKGDFQKQNNNEKKETNMSEESSQLTTAFQAPQSRMPNVLSSNPAALSEHLVRPNRASEPVDLDAEINKQLDDLSAALHLFERTNGKENTELLEVSREVNELQFKLDAARSKLADIQKLGTPLDRLKHSTIRAEQLLSKFISMYSDVVISQLIVERFGREGPIQKLPETKKEIRLHRRIDVLRNFEPIRTSSETAQALLQRADYAGERLDALRAHIQADNAKK